MAKRKYIMKRPRKLRKYTPQLKASILKAAYASGNVERWAKLNHINPSQLYNWRSQAKAQPKERTVFHAIAEGALRASKNGRGPAPLIVAFERQPSRRRGDPAVPFDVDILRELVRRAIKRYGFDPAKELGL